MDDFHTFGCPVFHLDSANQSGGIGTPKWEPRSHTGIYVGHSPCHAGSVALVLNLTTGLVSPQYHVIFDDKFVTVPYLQSMEEPSFWADLCKTSTEHSIEEQHNVYKEWYYPSQPAHTPVPTLVSEGATSLPALGTSVSEGAASCSAPINPTRDDLPSVIPVSEGASQLTASSLLQEPIVQHQQSQGEERKSVTFVDLDTMGLRRGKREKKTTSRVKESQVTDPKNKSLAFLRPKALMIMALTAFASSTSSIVNSNIASTSIHCYQTRVIEYNDFLETNFDGSINQLNPLAQIYQTSLSSNEVYNLKEMMQEPDRERFEVAMHKEVSSMFEENIWRQVPRKEMRDYYSEQRSNGIDINREQIMMIWSFKRKRHPDGTLDKYKARLCCHGGQQQWGLNFWDTYAPVVSWSSVRILMTLSRLHNLHTKSVDFVQAYPQAPIKSSIYLFPPAGVKLNPNKGDMVLKLLKNLYGLKDAGLTWFEHLSKGLNAMGFQPTASDPCIFQNGSNLIVLYVDNCIIVIIK